MVNFDFNFEILNELIRVNIWRSGSQNTGVKNLNDHWTVFKGQ